MASRPYGYFCNLFIAVDQFFNALFGGSCEETISAVMWRWHADGKRHWPYYVVNCLFFWQDDHCYQAYLSELDRKQLGDAYKKADADELVTVSSYAQNALVEQELTVVRCNLRGERDGWVFRTAAGETVEYKILSQEFLEKVRRREVCFSASTKLRCRVFDNYWVARVDEIVDG